MNLESIESIELVENFEILNNVAYASSLNQSNQGKPLVSFIVLSFNNASYIEECLLSIERQTFNSIEIIIADDGSSDSSPQIIKSFIDKIQRPAIAILSKNNNGIARIYNLCLCHCRSEIIAHIASDDINVLQRIAIQYELLMKSNASMCIGGLTLIDEKGKYIKTGSVNKKDQILQSILLSGYVQVTSPTMMYRADLITKFGYLPTNLANEDEALGFRAAAEAGIIICDVPLVKYRKHLKSISGKQEIYNLKRFIKWLVNNIPFQIANKLHWVDVLDITNADNESKLRAYELIETLKRTREDLLNIIIKKYTLNIIFILLLNKSRRQVLLSYLKIPARNMLYRFYKIRNYIFFSSK